MFNFKFSCSSPAPTTAAKVTEDEHNGWIASAIDGAADLDRIYDEESTDGGENGSNDNGGSNGKGNGGTSISLGKLGVVTVTQAEETTATFDPVLLEARGGKGKTTRNGGGGHFDSFLSSRSILKDEAREDSVHLSPPAEAAEDEARDDSIFALIRPSGGDFAESFLSSLTCGSSVNECREGFEEGTKGGMIDNKTRGGAAARSDLVKDEDALNKLIRRYKA